MIFNPKGAVLKAGKITSCIGNEIISTLFTDSKISLDFDTVKDLYGKVAFVDNSAIGRVSDIIGRVDSPYVVIELSKRKKVLPSSLIGKSIRI